jgi:hypothetical protein
MKQMMKMMPTHLSLTMVEPISYSYYSCWLWLDAKNRQLLYSEHVVHSKGKCLGEKSDVPVIHGRQPTLDKKRLVVNTSQTNCWKLPAS